MNTTIQDVNAEVTEVTAFNKNIKHSVIAQHKMKQEHISLCMNCMHTFVYNITVYM